jgi:hypothetical protein
LRTFTIGFEGSSADEGRSLRTAAPWELSK